MQNKVRFYEQTGVAMTCRNFSEYLHMFDLQEEHLLGRKILDTGAGASSFTAEAVRRGIDAYAADPLYSEDAAGLEERGRNEIGKFVAKLTERQHLFNWDLYGGPEQLRAIREQSFEAFLTHYKADSRLNRYTAASLPALPYEKESFDLILCSHFLFLYAEQFDQEFHRQALEELLRICRPGGEVRIYPLLAFDGSRYEHLPALIKQLGTKEISVEFRPTKLAFIPGSYDYLTLRKLAAKGVSSS
ncbi:class I SAM-dependent methyltransferase [Paenibacillus lutrae]|uniref:Methyltransferase domain-containing protein n=1 Tax=Paenibacillus lutrae TaxID=2078573 RepID=A0A7X3JY18_9BACL|nr:class I SAM-dependent methyltransferase [Paenibacillus lutrae]MVO98494.1 methyltransferase domain-containing protein [Paenibacillus lutrae]